MDASEIALNVKSYLVNLAANDNLPLDMDQLSLTELTEVIQGNVPDQDEIDKAGNFLSADDDDSIRAMIQLIRDHEDGSDLIANVEGVMAWEKIQNSMTCEEFLEQIQ